MNVMASAMVKDFQQSKMLRSGLAAMAARIISNTNLVRLLILYNHPLLAANGFASSCVSSLSCFICICSYKSNAFRLNTCPLMGILSLFISSTQKFNAFSTFTNILSRDTEVTFAVCIAALKLLRILSLLFTISRIEDSFFPYILATAAYDLPSFSTKSRILTFSLTESTSRLLLGLSSVPALLVFCFGAVITTTSRESFMFFNDSVIAKTDPNQENGHQLTGGLLTNQDFDETSG
ncbi:hypothetical protein M514_24068 [Trichuris suis]|uniref:Uncharacterized protein n=1 Tax=Trichuris suis TaxID=68888 RepID=A0A085N2L9_9BILA|nr:hypothetical protein M514_24068 [Trichuris suis]